MNDAVFILATIGALAYLVFNNKFDKIALTAISSGLTATLIFTLILVINFPVNFVFKDLVEVLKPLLYSSFVVAGYFLSKNYTQLKLEKFIIYASIISVIFSAFVMLPNLHPIVDLYKGRTSTSSFNLHFFRFSGTLGYPGSFGYWLVLPLLINFALLKRQIFSFRKFLLIFSILMYGMIMTGSRGAVVVLIAAFTLYSLINFDSRRNLKSTVLFITATIIATIAIVQFNEASISLDYLYSTIETGLGGSFNHRLNELNRLNTQLTTASIIGIGPNNAYLSGNFGPIESAYYYYGIKFGFLGLIYYISIASIFVYILQRAFRQDNKASLTVVFSIFAICTMLLGGVSNSITEEYKSFYMFFTMTGITLGFLRKTLSTKGTLKNPIENFQEL